MLKLKAAAASEAEIFPPNGILKAERFDRLREAESIEATARKEAALYLRRARKNARQIREKARHVGYAEGLSHFSAAVDRLDAARRQLRTRIDELLRQGLNGILGRMPKEEWLAVVLDDVLGELQGDAEIVVMTHPANLSALTSTIAAVKRRNGLHCSIRPEPNPQMTEEECLVYAGLEVIDVSVPVVVDEMIAALKAVPSSDEEDVDETEAKAVKRR